MLAQPISPGRPNQGEAFYLSPPQYNFDNSHSAFFLLALYVYRERPRSIGRCSC
jgi:hypothetical protein